jgi:hypothetical protein
MARSFFRAYLPKPLVDAIDWDSLTALPTEMESTSDTTLRADIIYIVKLRGFQRLRIILIVEHQSSFDNDMETRIGIYAVRKVRELKAQLPNNTLIAHGIVLHQNSRPWKNTRGLHPTAVRLPRPPINVKLLANRYAGPALFHLGFNLVDLATHAQRLDSSTTLIHMIDSLRNPTLKEIQNPARATEGHRYALFQSAIDNAGPRTTRRPTQLRELSGRRLSRAELRQR